MSCFLYNFKQLYALTFGFDFTDLTDAAALAVLAALAFSADAPPLHTYIYIYVCVIPHVIHIYIYIYICMLSVL